MDMIHALRHSNVLDLSVVNVCQQSRIGSVTRTISGPQLIARARSITASIAFLYKDQQIHSYSSWIALDPAIDEAKRIAIQLRLARDEPGKIAVDVEIRESSYALVNQSNLVSSLYALDDDGLRRAIEKMPGHGPLVTKYDAVWSSASSEEANSRRCNEVLDAFHLNARRQYDCITDAEKLFEQLRRQTA